MLPVTVVISRAPQPGREADLVSWADGVSRAARDFPGHLEARIYPPAASDRGELVVAFSFESAEALTVWEHSEVRDSWLRKLEGLVVGETRTHSVSGFEGIFSHAPGQAVVPPPRWKTAMIIGLALYPVSLVLNWILGPLIADWNIFLRVLVMVLVIVPYMAWIGVPYLTRWLRGWLHAS